MPKGTRRTRPSPERESIINVNVNTECGAHVLSQRAAVAATQQHFITNSNQPHTNPPSTRIRGLFVLLCGAQGRGALSPIVNTNFQFDFHLPTDLHTLSMRRAVCIAYIGAAVECGFVVRESMRYVQNRPFNTPTA